MLPAIYDSNYHIIQTRDYLMIQVEGGRDVRIIPLYEFTVDDPTTFTRPWTGIIPMTAIQGPIYEYACNEGNYGLADILRGARLEEKKRAEKGTHEVQPSTK